ncbi:hypothetical protein, partial [Escherichia coli]|uniref:hypothetical protein n=1 Tax=Escherichia coli TaxID=562 RepID=UPI0029DE4BAF
SSALAVSGEALARTVEVPVDLVLVGAGRDEVAAMALPLFDGEVGALALDASALRSGPMPGGGTRTRGALQVDAAALAAARGERLFAVGIDLDHSGAIEGTEPRFVPAEPGAAGGAAGEGSEGATVHVEDG